MNLETATLSICCLQVFSKGITQYIETTDATWKTSQCHIYN